LSVSNARSATTYPRSPVRNRALAGSGSAQPVSVRAGSALRVSDVMRTSFRLLTRPNSWDARELPRLHRSEFAVEWTFSDFIRKVPIRPITTGIGRHRLDVPDHEIENTHAWHPRSLYSLLRVATRLAFPARLFVLMTSSQSRSVTASAMGRGLGAIAGDANRIYPSGAASNGVFFPGHRTCFRSRSGTIYVRTASRSHNRLGLCRPYLNRSS
jgi:hypothetical protein